MKPTSLILFFAATIVPTLALGPVVRAITPSKAASAAPENSASAPVLFAVVDPGESFSSSLAPGDNQKGRAVALPTASGPAGSATTGTTKATSAPSTKAPSSSAASPGTALQSKPVSTNSAATSPQCQKMREDFNFYTGQMKELQDKNVLVRGVFFVDSPAK